MWSRSRRLGFETVSRRANVSVSSRTKYSTSQSRLGLGPMRLGSHLGLDSIRLGSLTISSRRYVLFRRVPCIAAVRPMKPVWHYSLVRIVRGSYIRYIRSCLLLFRLSTMVLTSLVHPYIKCCHFQWFSPYVSANVSGVAASRSRSRLGDTRLGSRLGLGSKGLVQTCTSLVTCCGGS